LIRWRQCFEETHFFCTEERGSRFLHKLTQIQNCLENEYQGISFPTDKALLYVVQMPKNHMNIVVVGLALPIHIQHATYGFEC